MLTSCLTQNHPSKRLLFGCCLSCLCQVSISNLTAIPGMQSLTLRQCKHSPIFLIIIRISVTRRTVERWYCCGLDAPHESAWRVGIDFSYDWCLAVGKDTNCWTHDACYLSESGFFYIQRPTFDCSQSVHFVGKISITTDFFIIFFVLNSQTRDAAPDSNSQPLELEQLISSECSCCRICIYVHLYHI